MEINSKLAYSISKADIKIRLKHSFQFNTSHASPTLRHEFNYAQPIVLDWPFKQTYMLNSRETVLLLLLFFLQKQWIPGQAKRDFNLVKAPPIMFTGSASLTSKPTLGIYLSKHSLTPNHVRTMLLKENGSTTKM